MSERQTEGDGKDIELGEGQERETNDRKAKCERRERERGGNEMEGREVEGRERQRSETNDRKAKRERERQGREVE